MKFNFLYKKANEKINPSDDLSSTVQKIVLEEFQKLKSSSKIFRLMPTAVIVFLITLLIIITSQQTNLYDSHYSLQRDSGEYEAGDIPRLSEPKIATENIIETAETPKISLKSSPVGNAETTSAAPDTNLNLRTAPAETGSLEPEQASAPDLQDKAVEIYAKPSQKTEIDKTDITDGEAVTNELSVDYEVKYQKNGNVVIEYFNNSSFIISFGRHYKLLDENKKEIPFNKEAIFALDLTLIAPGETNTLTIFLGEPYFSDLESGNYFVRHELFGQSAKTMEIPITIPAFMSPAS
ncbi:MAG: hypothetical protein LBR74_02425 [Eubacterium sp.]|jgi:cytoskeletal protein RodZ|nr:hypothetical protein [Eubacterium sp.]